MSDLQSLREPGRAFWTQDYYDALQFFYWEPQHIGRAGGAGAFDIAHLQRMEVSLNHLLVIFFRLAPNDFVLKVLNLALGWEDAPRFELLNGQTLKAYSEFTQPDLTFVGGSSCVSIEMKVGAKSSLEQCLKYATLHAALAPDAERHALVFLSPGDLASLFTQKFSSGAPLKAALNAEDANPTAARIRPPVPESRVKAAVQGLEIGHLTYRTLHRAAVEYLGAVALQQPYAATVEKLFQGLVFELEQRAPTLRINLDQAGEGLLQEPQ